MAEAAHPICKLLILSGICVMSYKIYNLTNEATTLMLEADKNVKEFDRTYDGFSTDDIIDTYREWTEKQTLLDTIASARRSSEEITEGVAEGTELQREMGYGVVEEESEEDS